MGIISSILEGLGIKKRTIVTPAYPRTGRVSSTKPSVSTASPKASAQTYSGLTARRAAEDEADRRRRARDDEDRRRDTGSAWDYIPPPAPCPAPYDYSAPSSCPSPSDCSSSDSGSSSCGGCD